MSVNNYNNRYIIHLDCNCFYASVEMIKNPRLRDVPFAVCGSVEERHGVVLTANYHAKTRGVKTGITVSEALKTCPGLYIVPPQFTDYIQYSGFVKSILATYTDRVEAFSIDECWLDITSSVSSYHQAEIIMCEMCERIGRELGISVSAGLADSKTTSKMAGEMHKPNGRTVITPNDFKSKIWPLPIGELIMIGRQREKHLLALGIRTIGDLAQSNPESLQGWFGLMGQVLFCISNGVDTTEVMPVDYVKPPEHVSHSHTFPRDLNSHQDVWAGICTLSDSVGAELYDLGVKAKTISFTYTNYDLSIIKMKNTTLAIPTYCSAVIADAAFGLFKRHWGDWPSPLRKIGIHATNFVTPAASEQISLFDTIEPPKNESLEKCLYDIRATHGNKSIQRGFLFTPEYKALCEVDAKRDHTIHPIGFFNEGSISIPWETYATAISRSAGR